jgi:hypothetical protein
MAKDWLPRSRVDQLAMAQDWVLTLIPATATRWNIPPEEVTKLSDLYNAATTLLYEAMSKDQTKTITAQCQAAFKALEEQMRFLKNRYFFVPPLTDADLATLGLSPKTPVHTPIPTPIDTVEAVISNPNLHIVQLLLRVIATNKIPDPNRSDHGNRIYYGVYPPGGATVEAATSKKRELMKIPVSGDELPHSVFTRRKKELIVFDAEDSGKTAYFCIRLENAKGEPGPWGPMLTAIIT